MTKFLKSLLWFLSKKKLITVISFITFSYCFYQFTRSGIIYLTPIAKTSTYHFLQLIIGILVAYGFKEVLKRFVTQVHINPIKKLFNYIPFKNRRLLNFPLIIGENIIFIIAGYSLLIFASKSSETFMNDELFAAAIFFFLNYGFLTFCLSVHYLILNGRKKAYLEISSYLNKNMKPDKYLLHAISIFKSLKFNLPEFSIVSDNEYNNSKAKLTFDKEKGYLLNINDDGYGRDFNDILNLNLQSENLNIHLPKLSVIKLGEGISGKVPNINSSKFDIDLKSYYRVLIPVDDNNVSVRLYMEEDYYTCEKSKTTGLIKVELDEVEFNCYKYNEKSDGSFFVIDTSSKMTYSKFSDYVFGISLSYGFITGNYYASHGYFFSYEEPEMKDVSSYCYTALRPSIKSFYQPINSNPFALQGIMSLEKAEKLYSDKLLTIVSNSEFNTLCNLIHNHIEFSSIILLILESSCSSLLVMPSSLAVALESLSNFIMDGHETSIKPINNPKLAKNIKNQTLKILADIEDKIPKENFDLLTKYYENFNQPRNQTKLSSPFELMGISLSSSDKGMLKRRNLLLHGNIGLNSKKKPLTLEESNKKILATAYGFLTLCNALILKKTGYTGYIIDYNFYMKDELKEDEIPYRHI